jgi:3'(2'), 5'-bisphosphate nucleotidase
VNNSSAHLILDLMTEAALVAGRESLKCRKLAVFGKLADHRVQQAMRMRLKSAGLPIVSEEDVESHSKDLSKGTFLVIDPIDGTDSFDRGEAQFACCIALVIDGLPAAGVICAPIERLVVRGGVAVQKNEEVELCEHLEVSGAWKTILTQSDCSSSDFRAVIGQAELTQASVSELLSLGVTSLSLLDSALCFLPLLRGDADILIRRHTVRIWDIIMGDALIRQAGGLICHLDLSPISYSWALTGVEGFIALIRAGDQARLRQTPISEAHLT